MFASAVLFLACVHYAIALETANCTLNSYLWMFNSLGQSPCRVCEFLSYPCDAWVVVPLNGSTWYDAGADNPCGCNTVMYNLLSACSMCQGGNQQGWLVYSQNCSQTYVGKFPEEIISTTAVPHWAYIDISSSGLLDLNEARAVGDAPESTQGFLSTATVTATQTERVTDTGSASKSSTLSSIVGPIVGGVVGGMAGIALIAIGSFYWISRRKMEMASQLGSPSSGPPSGFGPASSRHARAQRPRSYEPYEPQTLYQGPGTVRFPTIQNNASMYVTPLNTHGYDSGRNNV